MSKKIVFWQVETDENTYVYDPLAAQLIANQSGTEVVTDADIAAAFGTLAVKHVVLLNENSYALRLQINKLMQKPDEAQGSKQDTAPEVLLAARAEAVIKSWDYPAIITAETYLQLPIAVVEYLDAKIWNYIAPDIAKDPHFFAIWSARQTPPGDSSKA